MRPDNFFYQSGLVMRMLIAVACFSALLSSCRDAAAPDPVIAELLRLPPGWEAPAFPEDNALTADRWALGRKLFFEPALSRDSSLSCASCHQPALAFTDGRAKSIGVNGAIGMRNAPTLTNVGYAPYFMTEGGVATLEIQVGVPIQEHAEFDFNILLVAERLTRIPEYRQLSRAAYERDPDPFVITRALSTYERTMISGRSAYDRYLLGEESALDESQRRGMELFFSDRTACSQCHGGRTFTQYAFENNGLYSSYSDPGRARLTGLASDSARFKVPTLRNITETAPYMHDGSLLTLEEVMAHYRSGGEEHPNKSPLIRPLDLSDAEAGDVMAFLRSLSDPDFLTDDRFIPE